MVADYSIKTAQFEGPLELLLGLIEEKKLSINEISLAEVSGQYMERIKSMPDMPRRELASFLVVAATLMLIKSRSLLPSLEMTEEEEQSMEDLERRLKLYKRLHELSENIQNLYGKSPCLCRESFSGISVGFIEPEGVNISALHQALKNIVSALPVKEELPEKVVKKIIKIEDKMMELTERMSRAIRTSFSEFAGGTDRATVVVSFLAMLELVKQGLVAVRQEGQFGEINIMKN